MQDLLRNFRRYWLFAGFFSFFCNILALASPLYMLQVYDRVLTSRSPETLIALTVITLGMMVVMTLLEGVRSRVLQAAGLALEAQAGPLVVGRLMESSANPSRGPQQQATLRDTQLLSSFISGPGVQAFFDAPWVPVFVIIIFIMHWLLGLLALAGAMILFTTAVLNERMTRSALEEAAREQRRANRFVETSLQNAEVVVALGMQDNVVKRWRSLGDRGTRAQARAGKLGGIFSGSTRFFRQALQTLMLGVGAWAVISMQASSGIMIAATIILGKALAPVELAVAGWRAFVDARGAYNRLDELMREQQRDELNRTRLPEPRGALTVENVSFGVRNPDRVILRGVNFSLEPGESLGLIGPSAAGKSTLSRLVAGVWRASAGAVRLDGAELSQWDRGQLADYLGYLPQDVELLAGTVAENIARLGEVDSEKVVAAAQLAQVHELILGLPQGYETDIGERGVALSAGQRQRVGLARALYGKPKLVVLDEPNSNLDAAGEDGLVNCLRGMKAAGITVIVVSHKPSLLAGVDKLAVLREGKLELFGPTADVMRQLSKPAGAPLQAVNEGANVASNAALKVVGDDKPSTHDAKGPVRTGLAIIAVAFLGFGGWAALVPLSGAVIAGGEVKVESNRKTVQHLEGGIVAAINVRDGDVVKAGQTLIELQSEQVSASVDMVSGQLDAELAKNARLRSERERQETVEFPVSLTSRRNQPDVASLLDSETHFFETKKSALDAQLRLMQRQVAESRKEITGLEEQVAAEERAIALFEEEVAANRTLEAKQFVQKTQILALRRGLEDFAARRGAHKADIARAEQRITDLELRSIGLTDRYVQEAAAEFTDSQARIFDLQERIRPSKDALMRQKITAPIGGTVVGMTVFTVGGVIKPGETLMDIVPTQKKLIFEVKLDVKDIDEVRVGAEAEVRLSALDQRTTPLITGTVEYVSADRLTEPQSRVPYYLLHIVADAESLQRAAGLDIQPGMAAEVFVKTRERTLFQYWLEPITSVLRRTMRET